MDFRIDDVLYMYFCSGAKVLACERMDASDTNAYLRKVLLAGAYYRAFNLEGCAYN